MLKKENENNFKVILVIGLRCEFDFILDVVVRVLFFFFMFYIWILFEYKKYVSLRLNENVFYLKYIFCSKG